METIESVRDYIEANKAKAPFNESPLKNVQMLLGGYINYVYRLEFVNSITMVLKYYPPQFRIHREIQMPQDRYFVEKTALMMLEQRPLTGVNSQTIVRTPKVFYYDDQAYAIVMEDAGVNTCTLTDCLKKGGGESLGKEFLTKLAKGIHEFSSYLNSLTNDMSAEHRSILENNRAFDLVTGIIRKNCQDQTKRLGLESDLEPYLKAATSTTENGTNVKERVLVCGDLWPNSILVDRERELVWIVDWEMARLENSLSDMDRLMTNLWLMKQGERVNCVCSVEVLMWRLQCEFFGDEATDWRSRFSVYTFLSWVVTLVRDPRWELLDRQKEIVSRALDEAKYL